MSEAVLVNSFGAFGVIDTELAGGETVLYSYYPPDSQGVVANIGYATVSRAKKYLNNNRMMCEFHDEPRLYIQHTPECRR